MHVGLNSKQAICASIIRLILETEGSSPYKLIKVLSTANNFSHRWIKIYEIKSAVTISYQSFH
jgi:hypothetical protein